ncbi:MAG TPA: hypothetical protein DCS93_26365 [Microscillaceae bacterium]|nr:hypothetical protein [Microscillaceae bacterium]
MNFYWYIAEQEVNMLHQNLAKNWWDSFPLRLSVKTPWFDIEGSKSDVNAQNIKNLQKVVKKIEKQGELLGFENIDQEAPLFFGFEGAGIKLIEDDVVLVAIIKQDQALLLTGAAANLVGAKIETIKMQESNSLIRSIKNTWNEQEGISAGTVNEVVTELLKQASEHVFPKVRGLATFTSKQTAQAAAFKKIKRPEIRNIVIGNPLYIEQVAL